MEKKVDIKKINEKIKKESAFIDLLTLEINKVIVGQKSMIERLLIGLLGQGHILLEGVPGLAKTLAINTLSKAISGSFSRIQFTPDLLPADVVGTLIYNIKQTKFSVKKVTIFANFVLADEINLAPAKVQTALLEAMQDSFMLKTVIDYTNMEDEKSIIRANLAGLEEKIKPVVNIKQILKAQKLVNEVYMDEKIESYIVDIIFATRYPAKYNLPDLEPLISFGASPRGSINLALASKCYAFINRRGYVIPEDVRAVVHDVLQHRIGITYEAEAENLTSIDIINQIVNEIEVP